MGQKNKEEEETKGKKNPSTQISTSKCYPTAMSRIELEREACSYEEEMEQDSGRREIRTGLKNSCR